MTLPSFTNDDALPAGDYALTFDELKNSHLITGENSESSAWDAEWRRFLVGNLEILTRQLWRVGITEIFIDGSFVERKDHPNDIDGYFECEAKRIASKELHVKLNALDPHQIWTWDLMDRKPDTRSRKLQLPMWHRYRVELYPHYPGSLCGITDLYGNELEFPSAFRLSRSPYHPKGIVKIIAEK